MQEQLHKSGEQYAMLERENKGLQEQVKNEEKEFLEEEKEEESECLLEKKQLQGKVDVLEREALDIKAQNMHLKTDREKYQRNIDKLLSFREVADNCLKDISQLKKREIESKNMLNAGWKERCSHNVEEKKKTERMLDKCHTDIKEVYDKSKNQRFEVDNELAAMERKHSSLEKEANMVKLEYNKCMAKLNSEEETVRTGDCTESRDNLLNEYASLENGFKVLRSQFDECTAKLILTENTEISGKSYRIGSYSYIKKILYNSGMI